MVELLGWDEQWQSAWESCQFPSDSVPARVVRTERAAALVRSADTESTIPSADLVVGDWVALLEGSLPTPVLPRRTIVRRGDPGRTSDEQILAANVDVVVIVEPMVPAPAPGRVERLLTLAWSSGAQPLVVLTKADLGDRSDLGAVLEATAGVDVLTVSCVNGAGLYEFRRELSQRGRTHVLLGPSGAGKSTLINDLLGKGVAKTGEVRSDGAGRHTTSYRHLVPVPGIGCLIDTPGLRAIGMAGSHDGLADAFHDIFALAEDCRFGDCSHETEPDCAVADSLASGDLSLRRFRSFKRVETELLDQNRRSTDRGRAAERLDTKGRLKAKRVIMNAKGRRDR